MKQTSNNTIRENLIVSLLTVYSSDKFVQLYEFLGGELAVLFLVKHKSVNNPSAISKQLEITRARVTAILSSLSDKGLVILKNDPLDGRKIIIELTNEGILYVNAKEEALDEKFDLIIEKLGIEKTKELIEMINQINVVLK